MVPFCSYPKGMFSYLFNLSKFDLIKFQDPYHCTRTWCEHPFRAAGDSFKTAAGIKARDVVIMNMVSPTP